VRIALGVSYSGSGYEGWQSQLSGNTVQDKLELALANSPPSPSAPCAPAAPMPACMR
jgi:tRNA pseudouridine38-40 synthase